MSKIWFISDTHFFSENIIRYCNRPFANAAEMNERIIKVWNERVADDDDVYCLGDFVMHESENIPLVVPRLKGRIHLCRGNHDTRRKLSVLEQQPNIVEIKELAYIQYKNLFFVACHFPMTNQDFLDMVVKDNSEVVCVHGHVHDKTPFFTEATHSFNVSVDVTPDYGPVCIDDMYERCKRHFIEKGVWRKEVVK